MTAYEHWSTESPAPSVPDAWPDAASSRTPRPHPGSHAVLQMCVSGRDKAERGDAYGAIHDLSSAVEACVEVAGSEPSALWPGVEAAVTLASAWEVAGRPEEAREAWRDARTLLHQLDRCFPGRYEATFALVSAYEVRARRVAGLAGDVEARAAAELARRYHPPRVVGEVLADLERCPTAV